MEQKELKRTIAEINKFLLSEDRTIDCYKTLRDSNQVIKTYLEEIKQHLYQSHKILDIPVRDQELSVNVLRICDIHNHKTMNDIFLEKRETFVKYRGFGKRSLQELDDWFKARGFDLER